VRLRQLASDALEALGRRGGRNEAVDYDDDGYWYERGFETKASYVLIRVVNEDGTDAINPIHALHGDTVTIHMDKKTEVLDEYERP